MLMLRGLIQRARSFLTEVRSSAHRGLPGPGYCWAWAFLQIPGDRGSGFLLQRAWASQRRHPPRTQGPILGALLRAAVKHVVSRRCVAARTSSKFYAASMENWRQVEPEAMRLAYPGFPQRQPTVTKKLNRSRISWWRACPGFRPLRCGPASLQRWGPSFCLVGLGKWESACGCVPLAGGCYQSEIFSISQVGFVMLCRSQMGCLSCVQAGLWTESGYPGQGHVRLPRPAAGVRGEGVEKIAKILSPSTPFFECGRGFGRSSAARPRRTTAIAEA